MASVSGMLPLLQIIAIPTVFYFLLVRSSNLVYILQPPPSELLEELVIEILLRLPVKSLLRFKSVSKAWQAIISDPSFICSHLRQSASRWRHTDWIVASDCKRMLCVDVV